MNETASIKDWLGRKRSEDDELSVGSVRRLAAMLDQDPTPFRRGVELPEAWYAILFGPTAKQARIGPDGHPLTGGDDLMPPMHNTRRMFAGRRVKFHKPLKVGDLVERVSTIRQVEPKTGRTGSFTLVTVVHELNAGSGVAVTEEQDLVYREDVVGSTDSAAKPAQQAAPKAATATRGPATTFCRRSTTRAACSPAAARRFTGRCGSGTSSSGSRPSARSSRRPAAPARSAW